MAEVVRFSSAYRSKTGRCLHVASAAGDGAFCIAHPMEDKPADNELWVVESVPGRGSQVVRLRPRHDQTQCLSGKFAGDRAYLEPAASSYPDWQLWVQELDSASNADDNTMKLRCVHNHNYLAVVPGSRSDPNWEVVLRPRSAVYEQSWNQAAEFVDPIISQVAAEHETPGINDMEDFWQKIYQKQVLPYRVVYDNRPGETLYMAHFYTNYQLHIHVGRGGEVRAAHLKDQMNRRHMVNHIDARLVMMYWVGRVPFVPLSCAGNSQEADGGSEECSAGGEVLWSERRNAGTTEDGARQLLDQLPGAEEGMGCYVRGAHVAADLQVRGSALPVLVGHCNRIISEDGQKALLGEITEVTFGADWTHWWVGLPPSYCQDVPTFMGLISSILGALTAIPGANVAVPVLAAVLTAYGTAIVAANKGNGVWINSYYIAPGILIPSGA